MSDDGDVDADGGEGDGAARTVREERSPTPMRRTIAERLHESYSEAVHVTVSRDVDAGPMLAAAEAAATAPDEALDDGVDEDANADDVDSDANGDDDANGNDGANEDSDAAADAADDSPDPSLFDVLLCALSDALDDHPAFNATFEDGTHRLYEEQNVGVAVSLDEGLVTPVVADLGGKSLDEIASRRRELTDRVLEGDYTMRTFKGGTFTVSNLGPLGVDSFTPIINPPEVAILGVGRTTQRAVPAGDVGDASEADDAEGGVAFRPFLTLDLSFDHRVIDGADAARFLDTLAAHLADAETCVEG